MTSSKKSSNSKRSPGEIRQSQILSTFGPGSMVDLPKNSVIIGGLNHWRFAEPKRIYEERLAERICQILEVKDIAMREPPASNSDPTQPRTGIKAFIFPEWFVAQLDDEKWVSPTGKEYRTRPLLKRNRLVKGKYLTPDKHKKAVVPVRFVQACTNGHISDIDWYAYVHNDFETRCRAQLWLDEGGAGNDFADIFVRCEACKNLRRPLSEATLPNSKALGKCNGDRPWLGPDAREGCVSPETGRYVYNRLLVRSASNAYFSQTLNVISLPNSDEELRKAVNSVFEEFLQFVEDTDELKFCLKNPKVKSALEGFKNEAIWAEIQRRKGGASSQGDRKSIKQVEIETLLSQPDEVGEDAPDGDFYARTRKIDNLGAALQSRIGRVVLVHRLREVIAQVGFTRFEPAIPDIDGELKLNVQPAALDLDEPTWVPAVENKGEGVFIAFRKEAIEAWQELEPVKQRGRELNRGFEIWLKNHDIPADKFRFPGTSYIMLHSLSHLLITAVALECGYSASSIRERIYAGDSGYGILLYTGSAGSEGTLGGLVQVGQHIEQHLATALELGKLCSNDPVCAQHKPSDTYEERFLHGAACHGCLLIAETSCERRNEFLDRALVVNTVDGSAAAFFPEEIL